MAHRNINTAQSNSLYQRENRSTVTLCALSLIILGIVMIFAGGYISYIYFTEITPPNYDAYYQKYVGSSFPRISGILILMAGLTLFWGSSIVLVYTYYRGNSNPKHSRYYYDTTLPLPNLTSDQTVIKENYIS